MTIRTPAPQRVLRIRPSRRCGKIDRTATPQANAELIEQYRKANDRDYIAIGHSKGVDLMKAVATSALARERIEALVPETYTGRKKTVERATGIEPD